MAIIVKELCHYRIFITTILIAPTFTRKTEGHSWHNVNFISFFLEQRTPKSFNKTSNKKIYSKFRLCNLYLDYFEFFEGFCSVDFAFYGTQLQIIRLDARF